MNIIVAPDSFKDCLSAKAVAACISLGIRHVYPDAVIYEVPLSDGGEGLIDALMENVDGQLISVPVRNPLGHPMTAEFGVFENDNTAIIELARASGLELLSVHERDPLSTSTYGTGQLIRAALDHGCKKMIIGLGGSATNDGGSGMLKALGARFLNPAGMEIPEGGDGLGDLDQIDLTHFDRRLAHCEVIVASDVTNPLIGPHGASFIYGGQKGGDGKALEQLDNNLRNFGEIVKKQYHIDILNKQGAGAAGGTGAALLAFMNGKIVNGIELVLNMVRMEQYLGKADLVITGEGKIDKQTLNGKTIMGISGMAKKQGVPVIVLTGKIGENIDTIYDRGVGAVFSIVDRPMELEEALIEAPRLLERASMNIMGTIKAFNNKL